jgi:hypothetical protein
MWVEKAPRRILNADLTILDNANIMALKVQFHGCFLLVCRGYPTIFLDNENFSDGNENIMVIKQPRGEKAPAKADIVLHPIRFRILMIASGRRVSAQQIISGLPEVPQASAYRHIARLVEAGILQAVEEVTPRGTVEKTYTLPDQAADLSREEMAPVSSEDHMRYFTAFATLMLSQFRAYLDRKDRGGKDGGWYWSEAVCLTDAEYEHFVKALKAIEGLAVSHEPSPERRRRLIFTAIIPDVEDM